jgi:fumarylacetoacetase
MHADDPGLNETHDPARRSWVASANDPETDFPIQNLPFASFCARDDERWRPGVAIGDQVVDLWASGLERLGDLASIMAMPLDERQWLRRRLSHMLDASREAGGRSLVLLPQHSVRLGLPAAIGDYTDFYAGIHHARAVGALFRPDNPLLPNYHWVPVAYHGRASSVQASGHVFPRPWGQWMNPGAAAPSFGPTQKLDFELELGAIVGQPNGSGQPITLGQAPMHLFGLVLLNDWSARDIQAWEYQPLGPFLAKNFATTISPWVVTLEALQPFRCRPMAADREPPPLPYLDDVIDRREGAFAIELAVYLETQRDRNSGQAPHLLSQSGFQRASYWTLAQMLAHHTVNGCAVRTGDLIGTGTLSGPQADEAGSLLELTQGGKRPVVLANGESRCFLEDGDAIILRGRCQKPGFRAIGFGPCRGEVRAQEADHAGNPTRYA